MIKVLQFFYVDNGESIVKQPVFQCPIDGSVGSHRRTAINFNKPRLEVGIDHNVEPVKLKASLVVHNYF